MNNLREQAMISLVAFTGTLIAFATLYAWTDKVSTAIFLVALALYVLAIAAAAKPR